MSVEMVTLLVYYGMRMVLSGRLGWAVVGPLACRCGHV